MSRLFAHAVSPSKCAALFPLTVSACQDMVATAKSRADASLAAIYAEKDRTFENSGEAIDFAASELIISASLLSVVSHLSPEKDVRDEANKQVVELESYAIDNFESNRRLYEILKEVKASKKYQEEYEVEGRKHPEYAYWLKEQLEDYRRKGMELPDDQFKQVVQLQKELAELSTKFSQNISEDKTEVYFTEEELKGVPASVTAALKKREEDGKYILKMDYPTYFGVMKSCELASTREQMATAFNNRAYPVNDEVLREIISKRHQLAALLGFPSFAHLYISDKMAKTPDTAKEFVESLIPKLQKKWETEAELIKSHLHPSCVLSDEGNIQWFDITFMINEIKKNLLNVSETDIQEYFPMDATVKALFDIYQSFFDITFTEVNNGDELWHKDAKTLEVKDNKTGKSIGFIILDLFPRDGKYSHACCHSVVPPARLPGSETEFSPSLSVVIANFPTATADRPALFLHSDVETFFHEFGHAIHGLMGRSRMPTLAGTSVKRDFVELPSQMLEEWLWEPSILQSITSHYKTKQPLPKELIEAKVHSKNAFSGRDSLRQLQFATYSLDIFGLPFSTQPKEQLDTTSLFYEIEPRVLPGMKYAHNTHFESAFGHLTGYGAGYYGYMWSKVFALDVFEYIRSRDGLLDSKLGQRYVDCIIGVGGGKDPNDCLQEFLGREPNNEAFLRNIGV